MSLQDTLQQIPDSAKIVVATSSSALTLFGIPVEQWMYIMSAVVSLLFIVEKLPMLFTRVRQLKEWIRAKRKKQKEA